MEASQGFHHVLCKGCQKIQLYDRCTNSNSRNDDRFMSRSCEGCSPPTIKILGTGVGLCHDCIEVGHEDINNSALQAPASLPSEESTKSEILRFECSSCRKLGIACSCLRTTASKCENCLENDIECDCRVLRKPCDYCRPRRIECVGNEDKCTNCLRFGQECKPGERERDQEKNSSQYNLAEGPLDVIDGMKAARAFRNCISCEENLPYGAKCDRDLIACGRCRDRNQPCRYPSLTNTLPEEATRYCASCYRLKSRLTEGPFCDRCKSDQEDTTAVSEPCHACQIMNTKCDGAGRCSQCEKFGFQCLRPLSDSHKARRLSSFYNEGCSKPSESKSSPLSPVANVQIPTRYCHSRHYGPAGAESISTQSPLSKLAVECNRGSGLANTHSKAIPFAPARFNHATRFLEQCDHVEGTDPICLCGRGGKDGSQFLHLPPSPPPPAPPVSQKKNQTITSSCKEWNISCWAGSPCDSCKSSDLASSHSRHRYRRKKQRSKPSEVLDEKSCMTDDATVTEQPLEAESAAMDDKLEEITAEMDGLDTEDWCLVNSEDIDGVAEPETTKEVPTHSFRFW